MNSSSHAPIITIDGPAGSGKSTTARLLAARLGFSYLDTGAMYRAAALLVDRLRTYLDDEGEVAAMLAQLHLDFVPMEGETTVEPSSLGRQRVLLGTEDITNAIRTPRIDKLVSAVAANAQIRSHMVIVQREYAKRGRVVLEGRDTGTVVCPDANVKIYLEASPMDRAMRRLRQRGDGISSEALAAEQAELNRRDKADSERDISPLRKADDAIVVDTSILSIEEQVEKVYRICLERLKL